MCTPRMWMDFLMSADNERRRQAEADINGRPPSEVAMFLLRHYLRHDPEDGNRAMAAILLHNLLKSGQIVDRDTQREIGHELIFCVLDERVKRIKKTLCDTVAELAAFISPQDQWPGLLHRMLKWLKSDNPRRKESALMILARVSQYIGGQLHPYWGKLRSIFHECLNIPAPPEMRIAALGATTNFLLSIEVPMYRFQSLLPAMMQILTEAVNYNEEVTAQESLEMFLQLAGTKPWFFRPEVVQVVSYMLQIAQTESVEEDTRHLALEFIITLAEAKELACGMKREFPKFISRLLVFLMKMLLDIDDDPEDEVAVMSDNYNVGQDSLGRLAVCLRGNILVPLPCKLLNAYLADLDWRKRHAALITLAQIAKGCAKAMIKKHGRTRVVDTVEQIVKMVTNSLEDPNPHVRWAGTFATTQLAMELRPAFRWLLKPQSGMMAAQQNPQLKEILIYLEHLVNKIVASFLGTNSRLRWAAINTINQLSQKLHPYFQEQCHQWVVPALVGAMNNFQNPPEQADAAVSMMYGFISTLGEDHVQTYLPGILEFLSCLQDKPVLYEEVAERCKWADRNIVCH